MTRAKRWFVASAAAVLLLALVAYWGTRPSRVASFVVSQLGAELGLEISANGASEYRLRGGPRLVLRDVVARQPGAKDALLRAKRIDVALPWSTVQSGGKPLAISHVELDAPVLDLDALQRWLASRPESEQAMPTLSDGLRVRDGRVLGAGWSVDAVSLDVPRVMPDRVVDVRVAGRFVDAPMRVPFDLVAQLSKPANGAALTARGTVDVEQPDWRLASRVRLSGPLAIGDDIRIAPLRMSMASRFAQKDLDLPFAFAVNGPLRIAGATIALSPAGVALRGDGLVPDLEGRAALAYTDKASLHLAGKLATWPDTWPALPPPIGQSSSPLPFVLDYAGPLDFSDVAHLQATRDDTHFDGRFRLPDILAWIDAKDGAPLPPLAGRITTPQLEVAGAVLEGVDVRLEEPTLP